MHNHVSEEMSRDRKRRRSEVSQCLTVWRCDYKLLYSDCLELKEEEVWTEHRSSSGRIYFYNKKLDKSQWERPTKGTVKRFACLYSTTYLVAFEELNSLGFLLSTLVFKLTHCHIPELNLNCKLRPSHLHVPVEAHQHQGLVPTRLLGHMLILVAQV